jgi:Tol biopolymer transport system component
VPGDVRSLIPRLLRAKPWIILVCVAAALSLLVIAIFESGPRDLPAAGPVPFLPPAALFEEKRIGILAGDLDGAYPCIFSPDGGSVAFAGHKKGGWPGVYVVHGDHRSEEFERLESGLFFSRDGKTLTYVARKDGKTYVVRGGQMGEGFQQVEDFTMSPDGSTPAFVIGSQSGKRIIRVGDHEVGADSSHATLPTFGPEGKTLAYVGWKVEHRASTFLTDAVNKSTCRLIVGEWLGPWVDEISGPLIFSSDGKRVAYVARKGHKSFVMVNGNRDEAFDAIHSLRFTPDGRVAYAAVDGEKNYVVVGTRKTPAPGRVSGKLAFSSDGRTLAYAASEGNTAFVVVGDRRGEGFDLVSDPVLGPDGKTAAYWGARGKKHYPVIGDRVGPDHYNRWSSVDPVHFVFSPDGKTVAYKANGPAANFIVGERRYPEFPMTPPIFNADGTKIAFGTSDGKGFLWRVIEGPFGRPEGIPEGPDSAARESALVGYWKLDESDGTRVLDASGRKNHGKYVNAPEPLRDLPPLRFADRSARAFVRDGAQRIQIPGSPSLCLTDSLSLTLWIKTATESPERVQGLLEKCNLNATRKFAGYSLSLARSGAVVFELHTPPASQVCTSGINTVPEGTWAHVAAVYDAETQTARVFLDGKLIGMRKSLAPPHPCDDPLLIGSDFRLNHFEGAIDDVRVYERALSEEEVRSLASGEERPSRHSNH